MIPNKNNGNFLITSEASYKFTTVQKLFNIHQKMYIIYQKMISKIP